MKPILVHAHVFYPALWSELKRCIQNITPHPFQLYVTFVADHPDIESDIRETFPGAHILHVPNRGYDIGPFITVINQVQLADYSYVVKLHTKRDAPNSSSLFRHLTGGKWRDALLSIVRTREIFDAYLSAFGRNPCLGMQANYKLIVHNDVWNDKAVRRKLRTFFQESRLPPLRYSYVGGCMFIARAHIFEALQLLDFSSNDFVETNGHQTSFAHIVERLLGYFVSAQGYVIGDLVEDPDGKLSSKLLFHERFFRPIIRFFYQRKETETGKMIKVIRIPVYRSKVVL